MSTIRCDATLFTIGDWTLLRLPRSASAELPSRGMTVVEWRVPRRAAANAEIATEPDVPVVRGLVMAALARAATASEIRSARPGQEMRA